MVNADVVRSIFERRYGLNPRIFRAPGRVNLIGEHTDYNDGFVLPVAIDRDTAVAARSRDDNMIRVFSQNVDEECIFDLAVSRYSSTGSWPSYVEGVARILLDRGYAIGGADLVIYSDVPEGAGLSSSAALELSVATALITLNGVELAPKEVALISQQAEHEYAGTKSGIMDQYISAAGQVDHALLIDCRSLSFELISIHGADTVWIAMDTKVKHNLASSEYNERRRQCEEAVSVLVGRYPGIKALRDADLVQLEGVHELMDPVIFRRARHVISENDRTLRAANALSDGRMEAMGELMFASHDSLRDDYEVTSSELDHMVEAARVFQGCLGSRMTGGGFGGCTISLVRKGAEEEFVRTLTDSYERKFGFVPVPFLIHSARGAHEVTT